MNLFEKAIPFLFVYFIIVFFSFIQVFSKEKKISFTYIIYPILIIVLAFFASITTSEISPDFFTYQIAFNNIHNAVDIFNIGLAMEYGYIILNKVISNIFFDFNFFLLIFTGLVQLVLFISYKKISPYPILSLLLYFVHYYLGRDLIAIRSSLAYAIILLAIIDYSLNKHLSRYVIGVLIAASFHSSSFISLLLPVFYYLFKNDYKILFKIGFPIALIIGFLLPLDLVFSMAGVFIGTDSIKYEVYFNNENNFYALGVFNLTNVKNMAICFYFYLKNNEARNNEDFLIFSFFLGALGLMALNKLGIVAGRGFSQFVFIDTILIPLCLFENRRYKLQIFSFIVIYAAIMLLANISRDGAYFYKTVIF
ncbi:hypothetical protein IW01_19535 [Pectobacterium brasiliense]|uniref:EpsG family protein n=1 Tax=Pectobacterium brasiliense TaxID=180957 RepID=UPI0004E731A1|nr:EpsG family protein [Pectobacterium brasiliense]KFF63530.1 hypothetical protein IW01_19535 [Pectobacterium brasiliense]